MTRRLSICDSTVLLKHIPDHRNEDIITVVETQTMSKLLKKAYLLQLFINRVLSSLVFTFTLYTSFIYLSV